MAEWISEAIEANAAFVSRIDADRLCGEPPTRRVVITCMDSRINLEAIGIPSFAADGHSESRTAIIRTAGARCPERSLFLAVVKADLDEIVVLGHTECALVGAHGEMGSIVDVLRSRIGGRNVDTFLETIGASSQEDLGQWLGTIPGPFEGVTAQLAAIRSLPFLPHGVAVHGLVYDVETGEIHPVEDSGG